MSRFPKYLETPWLVLDDYENNEEVLDDIITCLGLEKMYRRLYILQELEENINNVDMKELEQILRETPALKIDVCTIAQNKIQSGELENYRLISEFDKLTGRMLNK
jgi:tRNA uridine 5-carbamoylmethylation protein Kti12